MSAALIHQVMSQKITEKKSISGIRFIVRQILPCNPQMDWATELNHTRVKVCQGPTICKGSNFCQSPTKISSFFWNIEPFKSIFLNWFGCHANVLFGINRIRIRVKSRRTGEDNSSNVIFRNIIYKISHNFHNQDIQKLIAKCNCKPTKGIFAQHIFSLQSIRCYQSAIQ